MGGIHLIRTEYAAGSNHADRRLLLLHGTYLYRRGLGTKYDILINIERILLILGRMIRRNVQRFKVIVVILYFGTFHYFIAHTNENTLYFIQCNRIGMRMTHLGLLRRQRNIDHLCLQLLFTHLSCKSILRLFQLRLDSCAGVVHHLSYLGAIFGGDISHAL